MANTEHFDAAVIEKKWQEYWEQNNTYVINNTSKNKENFYVLSEFSYPSGNLHVGHWYAFSLPDIVARYKSMKGFNVMYPTGFDAFGLPAENAAIKLGKDPQTWTWKHMDVMRKQFKTMGARFDWSREIVTADESYYKWTQWMFNHFYKNGLVYRATTKINWCEQDKTILANEQVINGQCERCGHNVIQRDMPQWMLKITEFADNLVDDLDDLDWSHSIKQAQREWIGRKEGSNIRFSVVTSGSNHKENNDISVFTTRADTLAGVTYLVLAPEHELVKELHSKIKNTSEIDTYIDSISTKSDLERQQCMEKTGVALEGVSAINPLNNEEIPIWISDYVLANFGTGAVMAVPAHDERDAEFAIKYNLPFKFVSLPSAGEKGSSNELITSGENSCITDVSKDLKKGSQEYINAQWNAMYDILDSAKDGVLPVGKRFCSTLEGRVINTDPRFNTKPASDVRVLITELVKGEVTKNYRLRDWGISRQRYWGCPIPIVYDPEGNPHAIEDKHLPWVLPTDVDHTPDGTAPLKRSAELQKRTTEIFGEGWTPEVDTMDTFVDSSWYFYRYLDSKNSEEFASAKTLDEWMPVDMYFGGAEHTTLHLLYSRFWTKALHRLGLVNYNEPYKRRFNRGLILGPDGSKMSKSKGNIIDPDKVVAQVGADTVRTYLAFMGPFNEPGNYPWDPNGVVGIRRFLDKIYRLKDNLCDETDKEITALLHKTIKKVEDDIERLKLNTAISAMMILVNHIEKKVISRTDYLKLIQLIAPFAPHIAEEIWFDVGGNDSVHNSKWPEFDTAYLIEEQTVLAVQVNGKVRTTIEITPNLSKDKIEKLVLNNEQVIKWTEGKSVKKFIYVPGKIANIVI